MITVSISARPKAVTTLISGCCKASARSEEHTSELQSPCNLVCRLLLEKKNSAPPAQHHPLVCEQPAFRADHTPHAQIHAALSAAPLALRGKVIQSHASHGCTVVLSPL